jgi:hypothetical protein
VDNYGGLPEDQGVILTIDFTNMKYTQSTLDKLEAIPEQAGYILRYERGTFQSGYCILEDKKVVVLNKFLQMEGRINTLLDIIPQLNINSELLSEESRKMFESVIARTAEHNQHK